MSKGKSQSAMISVNASPELRDWLKAKAAEGYRSMSAQAALLLNAAKAADAAQVKGIHGQPG